MPCLLQMLATMVIHFAQSLAALISSVHEIPKSWVMDRRHSCLGLPLLFLTSILLISSRHSISFFLRMCLMNFTCLFFISPNSLLVFAYSSAHLMVMCDIYDIPCILLRNHTSLHFLIVGKVLQHSKPALEWDEGNNAKFDFSSSLIAFYLPK